MEGETEEKKNEKKKEEEKDCIFACLASETKRRMLASLAWMSRADGQAGPGVAAAAAAAGAVVSVTAHVERNGWALIPVMQYKDVPQQPPPMLEILQHLCTLQ